MVILSHWKFISLPSSEDDVLAGALKRECGCAVWQRRDRSSSSRIDVLKRTYSELGSFVVRGRRVELILTPMERAVGGSWVRKRRAGFAQAEKGLNLAVMSVMNLVIMAGNSCLVSPGGRDGWLAGDWGVEVLSRCDAVAGGPFFAKETIGLRGVAGAVWLAGAYAARTT